MNESKNVGCRAFLKQTDNTGAKSAPKSPEELSPKLTLPVMLVTLPPYSAAN